MIGAGRALRRSGDAGDPLPLIPALYGLYELGTLPRRGQIAMLVGRSGSQKSGFAMWLASMWALPTLYVSMDMSSFTVANRLVSIHTGLSQDEVSLDPQDLIRSPEWGQQRDALVTKTRNQLDVDPLQFFLNSSPSIEQIDEQVRAWVELRDDYPHVIIIDNLLDMQRVSENSLQSDKDVLLMLKELARITNAFVLVVHHNKQDDNPIYPAPVGAIMNKLDQTPELILAVALDQEAENESHPIFRIATVKNRSGRASPTAKVYCELAAHPDRTWFGPLNKDWPTIEVDEVPDDWYDLARDDDEAGPVGSDAVDHQRPPAEEPESVRPGGGWVDGLGDGPEGVAAPTSDWGGGSGDGPDDGYGPGGFDELPGEDVDDGEVEHGAPAVPRPPWEE